MAQQPTTDVPMVGGEPAGRAMGRARIAIIAFIALQLLIPLRYYLGSDPYDERFSWRMFSAVRVHRCDLAATETPGDGAPRRIDLNREIHNAWITTLKRNRASVAEKFLRARCDGDGISSVTVTNRCRAPNGTMVEPIVWSIDCASGEIVAPEIVLEREATP